MITTTLRRALPMLLFSLITVTPAYAQYDAAFFTYPGFNGSTLTKDVSWDDYYYCYCVSGNFGWSFNDAAASVSLASGISATLYEDQNFGGSSVWLIGDVGDLNWFWPDFGQGMASSYFVALGAGGNYPELYKLTDYNIGGGGRVLGPWADGHTYNFIYYGPQSLKTGNYTVVLTADDNQFLGAFGPNSDVPDLSVYFGTCDIEHTQNCAQHAQVYSGEYASSTIEVPSVSRKPSINVTPKQLATTFLPLLNPKGLALAFNQTGIEYGLPFTKQSSGRRAGVSKRSFFSTDQPHSSAGYAQP
jgi:hypothetical protein